MRVVDRFSGEECCFTCIGERVTLLLEGMLTEGVYKEFQAKGYVVVPLYRSYSHGRGL